MSAEFYALVSKWRREPLPPFNLEFTFKGTQYKIVGVVQAGNKIRAENSDGKVFLFEAKNFYKKYGVKHEASAQDSLP